MSVATISGAVSGLDTASIINGLVSAESNQQTLLKNRQSTTQAAADAYSQLISAVNALSTQAAALAKTSAWAGATASSTSSNVTAKATSTTAASITFDVQSVAAAHTVISADSVSSSAAVVASGPLTVTKSDGSTASIEVGSGSLADVVQAINNSSTGLRASTVQTGAGQYRLQVAATSTGAASTFTVDGLDGFADGVNVLSAGTDARISVGTNPDTAFTATSSTNTFSNVVEGLSFTVSKLESAVTVSSSVDGTSVATQVDSLVKQANTVLTQLSADTAWNSSTKSGGPLLGESAARSLQQAILSTVSGAGAAGVEVTRDGAITFDQDKFLTAFKADPTKVAQQFGASVSFAPATGVTGSATLIRAGANTQPGSYAVHVDSAAAREEWQLENLTPPYAGHTIQLTQGSLSVDYTPQDTDSLSDVVSALNTRVRAAGLGIGVGSNGTTVVFTADNPGSASAFTASLDGVAGTKVSAGADVQGTIDGQAATGVGSALSLTSGTGGAVGMSLSLSVSDADVAASGGDVGSVTYKPGLAQAFVSLAGRETDSGSGILVSAQASQTKAVKDLQDQIDTWDTRLSDYRAQLTTQFTAMETALAALKSQTSAISGLTTSSSSSSSS